MQQAKLSVQVFEPLVQIGEIDPYGNRVFFMINKPAEGFVHYRFHGAEHGTYYFFFELLHTAMASPGFIINDGKVFGKFVQFGFTDMPGLQIRIGSAFSMTQVKFFLEVIVYVQRKAYLVKIIFKPVMLKQFFIIRRIIVKTVHRGIISLHQ